MSVFSQPKFQDNFSWTLVSRFTRKRKHAMAKTIWRKNNEGAGPIRICYKALGNNRVWVGVEREELDNWHFLESQKQFCGYVGISVG